MTTELDEARTCFVCGQTHEYTVLGSTNEFGPPDLDMRPPEMARSTIDCWIQRCPSCGYCAPDIRDGPELAAEVVKMETYSAQNSDDTYPDLANKFLCSALVYEAAGDPVAAGFSAVRAAWACDDAQAESAAIKARQQALAYFERARAEKIVFADQLGLEEAIIADLLRRSGRFDEVEAICEEGLAKSPEEVVAQVLRYQESLARAEDTGCYTIADATETAGN